MREAQGEAVSATELLNNRFTCLQKGLGFNLGFLFFPCRNVAERRLLKAAEENWFWGIAAP